MLRTVPGTQSWATLAGRTRWPRSLARTARHRRRSGEVLTLPEHAVDWARRHQLFVGTEADHPAMRENYNPIDVAQRGESVRHDERGPALHEPVDRRLHLAFRHRIET